MVHTEPVSARTLLTWSDRGADTPPPAHHVTRARSDRGPVLRLLEEPESKNRYGRVLVLTTPRGKKSATNLAFEVEAHVPDVRVVTVDVDDPSDHRTIFERLAPIVADLERSPREEKDVLLSA